jgi:FHS family L-fucose permease-like MFS transporter
MGPEETATQRLNLAQAFNPIGALTGMYIVMELVQKQMSPMSTEQRQDLNSMQFNLLKDHDLSALIGPYLGLGVATIILLLLIRITKMPLAGDKASNKEVGTAFEELMEVTNYRNGVIAQFFYVGAQVTCWTFIIQYGTHVFMAEGMEEKAAEILSQKYNILAMGLFTVSRFVCTWFLKYIQPGRLLSILAILAISFTIGVILFPDRNGLYCLVCISACMSLMFPTIYGIALRGVGENVKFAGAGLIMAILGGSFFPPIQALIIDSGVSFLGLSATNLSFIIPLICFCVVAVYGHRSYVTHYILNEI